MKLSRRDLLQAGCAAFGGNLLQDAATRPSSLARGPEDGVLVMIQVRGGWDWLSMTAPVDDPVYREVRPSLAIPRDRALRMQGSDHLCWHPSLADWRALHERGELAIFHNIGHAHPDLSHFESEAKWHTADPEGGRVHSGWLARALEKIPAGDSPFAALTIDEQSSQAFAGAARPALTRLENLRMKGDAAQIARLSTHYENAARERDAGLAALGSRMRDGARASAALSGIGATHVPVRAYPDTRLGRDLLTCSRLIVGGARCRVLFLTAPGFDTHSQQAEAGRPTVGFLADDLRLLAEATKCFLDDLKAARQARRVLVVLYSEFGRSLHENRVLGTEHGHCGVAFALGTGLRPGSYGKFPDLARIRALGPDQVIYNMIPFDADSFDYRSLFATVLERWFGVASEPILAGRFPTIDVL